MHYGDIDMLEGCFDAMKEQVRYMMRWVDSTGVMWMNSPCQWMNLGDWCPAFEFPPTEMVHTFYLWRCADLTARAAEALGRREDVVRYDELAARTAEAFHDRFYDERKGSYGAYGGNVFALRIGVPADRRDPGDRFAPAGHSVERGASRHGHIRHAVLFRDALRQRPERAGLRGDEQARLPELRLVDRAGRHDDMGAMERREFPQSSDVRRFARVVLPAVAGMTPILPSRLPAYRVPSGAAG